MVWLEVELDQRVENVHRDYVLSPLDRGLALSTVRAALVDATRRIGKRLGPERERDVVLGIDWATQDEAMARDVTNHHGWIAELLTRYYDPLYDRQLAKYAPRRAFRGGFDECRAYLAEA